MSLTGWYIGIAGMAVLISTRQTAARYAHITKKNKTIVFEMQRRFDLHGDKD